MSDSPVAQYMALAEQRIAAAFVADGLYVHLAGGVQGPHTLTFGLKLYEPTAANIAKALRLKNAVEAALGDAPARIYTERGVVLVEAPSPWPAVIEARSLKGQHLAVPLGITSRRLITGVDFSEPSQAHVVFVGPSGRGKSTAMRSALYHLARQLTPWQAVFCVVTFKPGDWRAVAELPHSWPLIIDPAEAAAALRHLVDDMHQRAREQVEVPHIFVVLDDLLNLLDAVDVVAELRQLASLGRAVGVHLVIGTQRLGKRGAGDAAVTGNIGTRLVFGTTDGQDAALFTGRGDTGAETLGRYLGDCLLVRDGQVMRLAAARVLDSDLDVLPRGPQLVKPWCTGAPVQQRGPYSPPAAPQPLSRPGAPGAPVQGLLPRRAPTPDDVAEIRKQYSLLGSKNATVKACYGVKNTLTWHWVSQALEESEVA